MSMARPPLRIVQVAALGFPSDQGSQVYVRGMCRALARRGHELRLACYGHGQWEWDGEFELLRAPSIPGYSRLRAGPDLVKPWLDLCLVGVLQEMPDGLLDLGRPGARERCASGDPTTQAAPSGNKSGLSDNTSCQKLANATVRESS